MLNLNVSEYAIGMHGSKLHLVAGDSTLWNRCLDTRDTEVFSTIKCYGHVLLWFTLENVL